MMKEIGGYIGFEQCNSPMLHENAIKLNCGRNALAYIIEAKKIRKIALPKFLCDSCENILKRRGVSVRYYSVGLDFKPEDIKIDEDEWLYLVNFYGQLSNDYIKNIKDKYHKIIVDHAQAYFQTPLADVDTLYTCRKFFGVPDGAILYTNTELGRKLERDESFERMRFLLGRFERTASEFYSEYVSNNRIFEEEPIKTMSKLTENLLRGVDYKNVRRVRTENFAYLQERFGGINKLKLKIPEGAFMYPLYLENGGSIRKKLQQIKIYIPTLWPAVLNKCSESELEYDMAANILPLPCDQRYDAEDMEYMYEMIKDK